MPYQCADCGLSGDVAADFPAVYTHYTGGMTIRRCPPCAERWDKEVETELAKVRGNGRDGRKRGND